MARTSKAMKKDWDFDVRMDSLNHQGVVYDNERYAVKVGENGQRDRVIASGHTKQYNAVSNRAVIGAIRNAFDSHNMKWDGQHYDAHRSGLTGKAVYQDTEDIKVTHDYKKMYARYNFMDETVKLPNVNDSLGLRLTAHNSFDRGSKVYITVGAVRLVCSNGMTAVDQTFNLFQKHTSKLTLGFVNESLEKAMDAFSALSKKGNVFAKMVDVALTQEEGIAVISNLGLSSPLRSGIAQIWNEQKFNAKYRWQQDSDRNLYNLFNAATEHVTHGVETDRFEYASEVTEGITKKINRLVHNPEELKKAKVMTEDAELLMAVTN